MRLSLIYIYKCKTLKVRNTKNPVFLYILVEVSHKQNKTLQLFEVLIPQNSTI